MALIRTPHAAVIVWNYDDRMTVKGAQRSSSFSKGFFNLDNKVNEVIISTVSLVSITTNKSKGDPVGTFNFTLAPTRNWVATLTPGSWCAILMSNEPLDASSFEHAKPNQVKMFGRIETVRVNVSVNDEAARSTSYVVSGQDWGSIFRNLIYSDPIVQDPSDEKGVQANAYYQQWQQNVFSDNNDTLVSGVPNNIQTILSIMGGAFKLPETGRLAKATHEISLPQELCEYFGFVDAEGNAISSVKFTDFLAFIWGPLTDEDQYDNSDVKQTGTCAINPFTLQGQHSLWDVLQEHSNIALNEMFLEMFWSAPDKGPQLLLYNRIRPFSYTKDPASNKIDTGMRSMFQYVPSHKLDDEAVINVSAGTNWHDKYNFAEIRPNTGEASWFNVLTTPKNQVSQGTDLGSDVWDREGFRPIIFSIKQLPYDQSSTTASPDLDAINRWVNLIQEWYFDSHRLLNGQVMLHGSSEYIPVGDNIMFDAGLIGITHNHNSGSVNENKIYVLAHVESVQNSFTVNSDGSRSFQTIIQFVRGILVNENKSLIGEGTIDTLASALSKSDSANRNMVYTASSIDPNKES
jgi:hypothetical protein